ncbi:hypothetical protein NM208_g1109 [Fusarium decemcellulare]|uniref:Uncharacterized protein n=1 Tax=Fusarium decemcellulare TaxID=57161 RepID=A0ACC1SXA3_9HYPO|nr:hypothetical protein NM208_g1109 [Fusarium decemcellulare]
MTTDPDAASPRKLSQLEELLQLKKIEPDVFQSVESLWHPPGGRGLYGGVVISQSLTAAQRTVEDDFVCNSIKSQFLLPGTDKAPVTYSVARLREGRSYVTRMVRAVQEGRYISVTMISFARKLSREHQHVRHAAIMARVEEPHTEERHNGCDVANDTYAPELSPVTLGESSFPPQDRVLRCWIRAPEQISQADDLTVHQAVLAFLSDWIAISVIPYVHGYFQFPEAILKSVKTSVLQGTDIGMLSTLSHSIYFHSSASIRADDWMLIEIHSPWAGNERCLAAAKMFATDGTMLATYFQEIDIPTLTWAVHRLNGVCAPVNSAFTSWELAQQLQKSSVKVLFTVLPLLEVAKEAAKQCGIPEHRIYVCEMHGVDHPTRNRDLLTIGDILAKGKTAPELEELQWAPGRSQQQVAFLSHSSGTSGAPKVAMITHANLIANILQMTLYEQKGRGGSSRRETVLGVLPHSHIYGVVMISHLSTFRGDSVIVLPKFDMSLMLASVARYQISTLNIVPPIILAMSKNPDLLRRYDLSSVKSIVSGGAPLSQQTIARLAAHRPDWVFRQAYGLTEAAGCACHTSAHDPWQGSSGSIVTGCEIKLVDRNDKEILGHGKTGEIWIKSPGNILGYLDDKVATNETFRETEDGRWLRSGDIGLFKQAPSGTEHIFIVDRVKELIKVKGNQVVPAELENLLLTHPAVAESRSIVLSTRILLEMAVTPFSEAPWLTGVPTPYYSQSHRNWQRTCESFINGLFKDGLQWQKAGSAPSDLWQTFAQAGFIVPCMPAPLPAAQLEAAGITELPGGLKVKDYDYFHYLMYRCGLWGPASVIVPGAAFGIPPIVNFGSQELQKRLLPDLLSGRTRSCIAITEPSGGSDVANLETTAVKTPDGKYYVVNGISTGIWADYATTGVRTGSEGAAGLSLLVIPLKNTRGVNCRKMEISGGGIGGTTFITFEDVKVPVDNLIGKEGHGFKYILTNFNHERLSLAISATVQSRKLLSTAFDYVIKREAFGKPLIDQPVVRNRLGSAGADLEAQWAWIEQLTYSMKILPKEEADRLLGGQTALAKVRAGKLLGQCAEQAQLLLGGNSVTLTGQGQLVEMISREIYLSRVPGGSEDVLLDLGVRQLLKLYREEINTLKRLNKL